MYRLRNCGHFARPHRVNPLQPGGLHLHGDRHTGSRFQYRYMYCLSGTVFLMAEIRLSSDRLIFIMRNSVLVTRYLFIEMTLRSTLTQVTACRLHYDVIKWKHFPRNWPFVRGIHRSPVNSPHKGQWRGALMISLFCAWINDWVNNREGGDLRRYRAHYDVMVMI